MCGLAACEEMLLWRLCIGGFVLTYDSNMQEDCLVNGKTCIWLVEMIVTSIIDKIKMNWLSVKI